MNTETAKQKLEAEKETLEAELGAHGKLNPETHDWQGTAAEGEAEGPDENTVADVMEELVTNVAVVEELEVRYKNVLKALEKIESGTYGVCEVGGEPIPAERLEANPAATTCIEHA